MLQREPDHVEAMGSYPMALFKLRRTREALEGWRRYFAATRADRWDFESLYYTALCCQRLGCSSIGPVTDSWSCWAHGPSPILRRPEADA